MTQPLSPLPGQFKMANGQSIPLMRTIQSYQPANPAWMRPAETTLQASRPWPARAVQVRAEGETMGGLPWVVMKFGGTSVSTPERWKVITDQMLKIRAAGMRPFVAISALGSVTNRLIRSIDDALEKDMAPGTEGSCYKWIYDAHMDLAKEL